MMKFAFIIHAHPLYSGSRHAIEFIKAALGSDHQIVGVFFHQDGVYTASQVSEIIHSNSNIYMDWQDLAAQHKIRLECCSSSCLIRGIHEKSLPSQFHLSGLAQFFLNAKLADQVMQFHS